MDANAIKDMTAFLVPFLPDLTSAASKAVDEVGKQFGAEAFAKAKSIWAKLHPSLQARPAALEAVQDVAADASDSGSGYRA